MTKTRDMVRLLETVGPIDPGAMNAQDARRAYNAFRSSMGREGNKSTLLTREEDNLKFEKTEAMVVGLSLLPHTASGFNVCRFATKACRAGCVAYAGSGRWPSAIGGRKIKTRFLAENPQAFVTLLDYELSLAVRRAKGKRLVARLNAFSDIPWERIAPKLFEREGIVFYDYTKWTESTRQDLPANYSLTQSAHENTTDEQIQDSARNWAVVFNITRGNDLPNTYLGKPVVDGDKSDDRSLDPAGVIVGLRAKGSIRRTGAEMLREA